MIIHQIPKGEVCVSFIKSNLPVIGRDDLCDLSKCIVTKIKFEGKPIYFTCNYRSPSQTPNKIENYCQMFYLTLRNIFVTLFVNSYWRFNASCRSWWAGDINSIAGIELYSLTSTAGSSINRLTFLVADLLALI